MNYTNNHHLPQWEKNDRILMEDFNSAMAGLDAGLEAAVQHGTNAASAAQSAASALANRAQSTADSAVSKANAAQQTADQSFKPGYLPFKTGNYRGNGTTQDVAIGFKPSLIIIAQSSAVPTITTVEATNLKLTSFGITVTHLENQAASSSINTPGYFYSYIAFR